MDLTGGSEMSTIIPKSVDLPLSVDNPNHRNLKTTSFSMLKFDITKQSTKRKLKFAEEV